MPPVKRDQIIKRLNEHGIHFAEVSLQNNVTILISELGGRIYGPFLTPESDSLFWAPSEFTDPDAFTAHIQNSWNLGGERFWIAPEIQYIVHDRNDYFGTIHIPSEMDPGHWHLESLDSGRFRISQECSLQAYNLTSGQKDLHIEVTCSPAPNPLRHLSAFESLMNGVIYAGYEQQIHLQEGRRDDIFSAAWNLIQLQPGGELFIPCTPAVDPICYKGTLDKRVITVHPHFVRFKITADQMYKAGLKAAHTFGRMAYFHRRENNSSYLLIRNFSVHPGAEYPEEPPHLPGRRGDVIHVYNDDGSFADMGEMECNGGTIGGPDGPSEINDSFSLHLYYGPEDRLKAILFEMLGVEI